MDRERKWVGPIMHLMVQFLHELGYTIFSPTSRQIWQLHYSQKFA